MNLPENAIEAGTPNYPRTNSVKKKHSRTT